MKKVYRNERDYLDQYDPKAYAAPLVTVDVGIFTLHEDQLKVLLVRRGEYPEKDKWALPGGFVDINRDGTLESTAMHKLQAKTGVKSPYLEQLETIGNAQRDPRGWSMTVMYFALIPYVELDANTVKIEPSADAVAESIAWVSVESAARKKLAFDHLDLLQRALERIRNKVLYTVMPAYLMDSTFTLSQLQRAYEIIMDRAIEKKAFRRRLEHADVLEETGTFVSEGPGRPAMLYRVKRGVKQFNFARQLSQ